MVRADEDAGPADCALHRCKASDGLKTREGRVMRLEGLMQGEGGGAECRLSCPLLSCDAAFRRTDRPFPYESAGTAKG